MSTKMECLRFACNAHDHWTQTRREGKKALREFNSLSWFVEEEADRKRSLQEVLMVCADGMKFWARDNNFWLERAMKK